MDLLIKNMEMPKEGGLVIEITKHGQVAQLFKDGSLLRKGCKAIQLPPHGELISKGNILFQLQVEVLGIDPNDKDFDGIKKGILLARKAICDSPTVLEATE